MKILIILLLLISWILPIIFTIYVYKQNCKLYLKDKNKHLYIFFYQKNKILQFIASIVPIANIFQLTMLFKDYKRNYIFFNENKIKFLFEDIYNKIKDKPETIPLKLKWIEITNKYDYIIKNDVIYTSFLNNKIEIIHTLINDLSPEVLVNMEVKLMDSLNKLVNLMDNYIDEIDNEQNICDNKIEKYLILQLNNFDYDLEQATQDINDIKQNMKLLNKNNNL
jgi:hypothetical protein